MLYIKTKINNSIEIKLDLYEDEIFSTCPDCGVEQEVDKETLISVIQDDDLSSTSIFCERCSKERIKNMDTEHKSTSEEVHVIDLNADHESLKRSVDNLWNFIYTGYRITEIFADDEGLIHYQVRYPNQGN